MASNTDILSAAQNYTTAAKMQTVSGIDNTTPDDAARAVQLESLTGTPAQVIAPNLEEFDQQTKRNMASSIVSRNPALMQYVNSHPMAAGVSSDDWGNLDNFSRGASQTAKALVNLNTPWEAGFTGAIQGAKEGITAPFQTPTVPTPPNWSSATRP